MKHLQSRFGCFLLFGVVFVAVSFLLRTAFLVQSAGAVDWGFFPIARVYAVGLFFDLITFLYIASPLMLFLLLTPERFLRWKPTRIVVMAGFAVAIIALVFDVAAEWLFWQEFEHRFNFIAVDYLVYTQEVIENIRESYPLPLIFTGIVAVAGGLFALIGKPLWRSLSNTSAKTPIRARIAVGAAYLAVVVVTAVFVNQLLAERAPNQYNNELSKNGFYSLFAAFRNNTIDYAGFYATRDTAQVMARLREMVKTDDCEFCGPGGADLARTIHNDGPPRKLNVVVITVESLSASFLGSFGNPKGLTPNLDELAKQSLVFRQLYATGTRTDRGLEAIALSIPPTPGRSMLKRPSNENMFTLGKLLQQKGYETRFIYGGYGYFDNMNYFFGHNGFGITDRTDFSPQEKTFVNAWGVCDGDLLARVIKEGRGCCERKTPFFFEVMTTSNHRPYTYPDGKIDVPSGTGRDGSVKYTDYALGEFFRQVRRESWFDETLFVVIADHCASSAGKTEITADKYHIPLFIYCPKYVPPGENQSLCSQIDLAPTLLGLLNMSYTSRFFGQDAIKSDPGRALIGNYQKLGLYCRGKLVVLGPQGKNKFYQVDANGGQTEIAPDRALLLDVISYYQGASYLLKNRAMSDLPE